MSWNRDMFNPSRPVRVRRAFEAGGRKYARGDAFDWRALKVSEHRAKAMFGAGYLGHEVPAAARPAGPPPPPAKREAASRGRAPAGR